MAKKRTSIRRRPAAGYTAGPKRIRRRKLNGARRVTRRRSGRIGAVRMEGAIASVVKFSVGAIAGSFAMGMAKTIAPNFYVRSGGAVVLGLVLAKAMPKMSQLPVPGAIKPARTADPVVRGIKSPQQLLNPIPDFATEAKKQADQAAKAAKKAEAAAKKQAAAQAKAAKKAATAAKKAQARQLRIETRNRRAFERARAKRTKTETRTSTRFGTRGSLQRWANELLGNNPMASLTGRLTGLRSPGVASAGPEGQKCQPKDPCKQAAARRAATSRKRKLGSKARICYSGTWRDTRKGRVTLTEKRIPCL